MWLRYYDEEKKEKVKCGQIANSTYYKKVKKGNILKLNDSVGIQREILDKLTEMGIENIKCKIESRGIYCSHTSDWLQPGVWQKNWKKHGNQRFLPIKDMAQQEPKTDV